jgi:hypothetical protein
MDDLKLIAKSEKELQRQIQTDKTFSDDIHMEFGLEKCATITLKRSKFISSQNLRNTRAGTGKNVHVPRD